MKYINTLKYAAVFILTSCFLIACHSSENKESKLQTGQPTMTDTAHEHEATAELSLNNGVKWKSDSSTNKNVSALRNVIENAKPASLEGYHNTGKALQEGINKMISECRMKGPDHGALHHWLEPLMEENKKLAASGSNAEAAEAFEIIKKQISLYPQFFDE